MNLEKSLAVDPELEYLETIDSTNLELARRLEGSLLPDGYAIAAAAQTAGRGRLDRSWVSEPGTSISLSMFLKPAAGMEQGLIPLFFGSRVAMAVASITGQTAAVKWPNDVLVDGRKISGVLAELGSQGVVVGVGINVERQLGAPETSCAVSEFVSSSFDETLSAVLGALRTGWKSWRELGNGFALSEIRASSLTVGKEVKAILPSGEVLEGKAHAIEDDGRLLIVGEQSHLLSAADVWHLRN